MDVDGEPSASEPTFTPPGSLPRVEELPVEQQELQDIDFDLLEQQQFDGQQQQQQQQQQLDNTARESWADQQDQPEGLNPNVDLIDLGGDGAASGAPAAIDPEPVAEGPPNFNIFHGESPPRLIETKEEIASGGAAPSAPKSEPAATTKKEEQPEEPQVDSAIGVVDYGADDEELEEEETAPTEGAAPSAPSRRRAEEEFQPVRRRGTRAGKDERRKAFRRHFHQVGLPGAHRWLRSYTNHVCGVGFELGNVYLTDTPDYSPLVRYLGQFEEEDANADPILAIARLIRFLPGLRTFLHNRCGTLLQQVYQRNRELNQEHRNRPFGSNPLDFFENPVRQRGDPIRADFEGAGAQFVRDLRAGRYPELVEQQDQEATENRQQQGEEGPPSSGWRPTLRLPAQPPPDHRPAKAQAQSRPSNRLPSPPNYPPPNFSPVEVRQYEPPPLPPPADPPPTDPPLVLPRDRPQPPQHPPGPPRSARLEQQAKTRVDPNTPRGRAVARGAAPGAPTSRPKVVLKERDSSDPRDNRKP